MKTKLTAIYSTPIFFLMTIIFISGIIIGGFTGIMSSQNDAINQLATFITDGQIVESGLIFLFVNTFISIIAWYFLCFIAGMFVPPSFFIGLIILIRGFSFSLAISSMVSSLGVSGIILSLQTTGIVSLLSIPCTIIMATVAYKSTTEGTKRNYINAFLSYKNAILFCILCAVVTSILRLIIMFISVKF